MSGTGTGAGPCGRKRGLLGEPGPGLAPGTGPGAALSRGRRGAGPGCGRARGEPGSVRPGLGAVTAAPSGLPPDTASSGAQPGLGGHRGGPRGVAGATGRPPGPGAPRGGHGAFVGAWCGGRVPGSEPVWVFSAPLLARDRPCPARGGAARSPPGALRPHRACDRQLKCGFPPPAARTLRMRGTNGRRKAKAGTSTIKARRNTAHAPGVAPPARALSESETRGEPGAGRGGGEEMAPSPPCPQSALPPHHVPAAGRSRGSS